MNLLGHSPTAQLPKLSELPRRIEKLALLPFETERIEGEQQTLNLASTIGKIMGEVPFSQNCDSIVQQIVQEFEPVTSA